VPPPDPARAQGAPPQLIALARARVASAVAGDVGLATPDVAHDQLVHLDDFEDSVAFDEIERLVLRLASALTAVPVRATDGLRHELIARLGETAYLDLAATIADEHRRLELAVALGDAPAPPQTDLDEAPAAVDLVALEAEDVVQVDAQPGGAVVNAGSEPLARLHGPLTLGFGPRSASSDRRPHLPWG